MLPSQPCLFGSVDAIDQRVFARVECLLSGHLMVLFVRQMRDDFVDSIDSILSSSFSQQVVLDLHKLIE